MSTGHSPFSQADHPASAKVGRDYWDDNWADGALPALIDPNDAGFRNWVNRSLHAYFLARLGMEPRGRKLLEVGCARSGWLPYFHRVLGFDVAGLDYSPIGCRQSEAVLAAAGVPGEVVCADLFTPPEAFRDRFDVIVSFGVMEHFDDPTAAIGAAASLLRPGGLLFTMIPNLGGIPGWLLRRIDRPLYDIHNPLSAGALAAAHAASGLEVVDSRYFLPFHSGVLWSRRRSLASLAVRKLGGMVTLAAWAAGRLGLPLAGSRAASPYVLCVARKPLQGDP